MKLKEFNFEFQDESSAEKMLVELSFYFSVLMEYQLNDLQVNVRDFVEAMSNAIQQMDSLVEAEGQSAQSLYESLFNQQKMEASHLNARADRRAQDIFLDALEKLHPGQTPVQIFNSDPNTPKGPEEKINTEVQQNKQEATDKIWSEVAKKFESFCRLEERLRPQVFIMIQSLNFEDIQTQRIEHAINAQKKLNEGIMHFLKKGLQSCSTDEVKIFAKDLVQKTRDSYTMKDERDVFDQVFISPEKNKS